MKAWILPFLFSPVLFAQISIVGSGASGSYQLNLADTYSQNFDTLANSGTIYTFTDNVTLPGWHASGSFYAINATGGVGSYGNTSAIDRALGSGGGDTWAICFVNTTGMTITGFDLSYTGEQWRRGANTPQFIDNLLFNYEIYPAGTGSYIGTSWTNVPTLGYSSPNHTDTTSALLNGNLPENQVAVSGSVLGISLAPGQEIWLRWNVSDDLSRNDHALAIDDLTIRFIAIPEPASFATFAGLLGLGLATLRRRRA